MEHELLAVVDEADRVVGTRRRGDIHALGLRHRAVHILVFNSHGELFVQKRSQHKDINPGLWDTSAAGHVDAGEEYDGCAIRELEEELGIRLDRPPERLFKIPACRETGMEFIQVYRLTHDGPLRLHPEEIEAGGWYAVAQFNAWLDKGGHDITESLKLIWRHFREQP